MSFNLLSREWFNTASEILSLAARGKNRSEFERAAMFGAYEAGRSADYQLAVLNRLIREEIVVQLGDTLKLGDLETLSWLDDMLYDGHRAAWEFVTTYEGLTGRKKKFDSARLAEIGRCGEDFVVDILTEQLPTELKSEVLHVSKLDDTLGYDIEAPSLRIDGARRFLEVKTSEKFFGDGFKLYLSKNEFLRGCGDPRWSIVGVAKVDGIHQILGFVQAHQIESMLPRNVNPNASWEVAALNIEREMWQMGLP